MVKNHSKKIIGIIAAFMIILSIAYLESEKKHRDFPSTEQTTTSNRKKLPPAELKNILTKEIVSLNKFKGKVVLMNFWASWCTACIDEMPSLVSLYNSLKNEGFELISINVDENPEKIVPQIIQKFQMNFPVYTEEKETLVTTFDVVAIPFNIAVNRQQEILWSESGERDWASDKVITEFRNLLKNP